MYEEKKNTFASQYPASDRFGCFPDGLRLCAGSRSTDRNLPGNGNRRLIVSGPGAAGKRFGRGDGGCAGRSRYGLYPRLLYGYQPGARRADRNPGRLQRGGGHGYPRDLTPGDLSCRRRPAGTLPGNDRRVSVAGCGSGGRGDDIKRCRFGGGAFVRAAGRRRSGGSQRRNSG